MDKRRSFYAFLLILHLIQKTHQQNATEALVNAQNQTESLDNTITKSRTLYDYYTRKVAYKDLTESRCIIQFLNRSTDSINIDNDILKNGKSTNKNIYVSNKLSKRQIYILAGSRITEFCRGFPTYLVKDTTLQNDGEYVNDLPIEDEAKDDTLRIKRSTRHYFVGKVRGQTQSQYLNFGQTNEPGKAEAESTQEGSKAVVSGSSGIGQAQSQSSSFDCGDCGAGDQQSQVLQYGQSAKPERLGQSYNPEPILIPNAGRGSSYQRGPNQQTGQDISRGGASFQPNQDNSRIYGPSGTGGFQPTSQGGQESAREGAYGQNAPSAGPSFTTGGQTGQEVSRQGPYTQEPLRQGAHGQNVPHTRPSYTPRGQVGQEISREGPSAGHSYTHGGQTGQDSSRDGPYGPNVSHTRPSYTPSGQAGQTISREGPVAGHSYTQGGQTPLARPSYGQTGQEISREGSLYTPTAQAGQVTTGESFYGQNKPIGGYSYTPGGQTGQETQRPGPQVTGHEISRGGGYKPAQETLTGGYFQPGQATQQPGHYQPNQIGTYGPSAQGSYQPNLGHDISRGGNTYQANQGGYQPTGGTGQQYSYPTSQGESYQSPNLPTGQTGYYDSGGKFNGQLSGDYQTQHGQSGRFSGTFSGRYDSRGGAAGTAQTIGNGAYPALNIQTGGQPDRYQDRGSFQPNQRPSGASNQPTDSGRIVQNPLGPQTNQFLSNLGQYPGENYNSQGPTSGSRQEFDASRPTSGSGQDFDSTRPNYPNTNGPQENTFGGPTGGSYGPSQNNYNNFGQSHGPQRGGYNSQDPYNSGRPTQGGETNYNSGQDPYNNGQRLNPPDTETLHEPTEKIDDSDSQAQSSVQQKSNGTQASAQAQGRHAGGTSQSQVSGTYSGSGSFSASAGSDDGKRGALTQVSGGQNGAQSSAQGHGGVGQAQSQVILSSETGQTMSSAQSSGLNHGTQSQVQASNKGGMADAQANGAGSTASQAQIGFSPYDESEVDSIGNSSFGGGGSASAQGGTNSGLTQSQITGKFRKGLRYVGAAQAGSGPTGTKFNKTKLDGVTHLEPLKLDKTLTASPEKEPLQIAVASPANNDSQTLPETTIKPDYDEEYDDTEYDESTEPAQTRSLITQKSKSQQQHIVLDPLEDLDATVYQSKDGFPAPGTVLQPGQKIPGAKGYQIPAGFRGHVKSISSGPNTYTIGQNSHAQSVTLNPGSGRIYYQKPIYALGSKTQSRNGQFGYGTGYSLQPVQYQVKSGQSAPNFISVTKSETGSTNPNTGVKTPKLSYTQSSTCGIFTNTCVFNGSGKLCFPVPKTNPDGSRVTC